MPTSFASLCLLPTYVVDAGSSPTRTVARHGCTPPSFRSPTAFFTLALTSAETTLPSMIRATKQLVCNSHALFCLAMCRQHAEENSRRLPTGFLYRAEPLERVRTMKYRSRTEIASRILESATGGATKTKIMYKAFLSYAQLKEYLSVLIENNLIECLEGTQTYKTTEKGLNFLKMYNEIGELLQTTINK